MATKQDKTALLVNSFYTVPYKLYAPVRNQLFDILRAVNKMRKPQGLDLLAVKWVYIKTHYSGSRY